MTQKFGELLRTARKDAGISRDALALELCIAPQYLSDVEHGRRLPWAAPRVRAAAEFLGADPAQFIEAAGRARGGFELVADDDARKLRLAAALAERWAQLPAAVVERLEAALCSGPAAANYRSA